MTIQPRLTRRATLGIVGLGLSGLSVFTPAVAATSAAEQEIAKILMGRTAKDSGLKLDMPSIAENGLVVPLTVEVDSPMTEVDHIKAVHVIATGNPNPVVGSFFFTAASGRASASTRMRLAQTQEIVAIAETSTGELRMTRTEVKVTIGGCGG